MKEFYDLYRETDPDCQECGRGKIPEIEYFRLSGLFFSASLMFGAIITGLFWFFSWISGQLPWIFLHWKIIFILTSVFFLVLCLIPKSFKFTVWGKRFWAFEDLAGRDHIHDQDVNKYFRLEKVDKFVKPFYKEVKSPDHINGAILEVFAGGGLSRLWRKTRRIINSEDMWVICRFKDLFQVWLKDRGGQKLGPFPITYAVWVVNRFKSVDHYFRWYRLITDQAYGMIRANEAALLYLEGTRKKHPSKTAMHAREIIEWSQSRVIGKIGINGIDHNNLKTGAPSTLEEIESKIKEAEEIAS